MAPPLLRFEKLNEAVFANTVSQAQRSAAALEPKILRLYEILKTGERDRDRERVRGRDRGGQQAEARDRREAKRVNSSTVLSSTCSSLTL